MVRQYAKRIDAPVKIGLLKRPRLKVPFMSVEEYDGRYKD